MKRFALLYGKLLAAVCVAGPGMPPESAADPVYTFQEFDVPLADGEGTSAFGINNKGAIVGNFVSADGAVEGFVFEKGRFTYVAPGTGFFAGTLDEINDAGNCVGTFGVGDGSGNTIAFLRSRKGRITLLPRPEPDAVAMQALGINNRGAIVGFYIDANGRRHGFIRDNGRYTTYDHPDALGTGLKGVNDHGEIVGQYFDGLQFRSFLLIGDEPIPIEPPDSLNTLISGINNRGQIVGSYQDVDGVFHGYLFDGGESFTLDFPSAFNTDLLGINDHGVIVGTYNDFTRGRVAIPN